MCLNSFVFCLISAMALKSIMFISYPSWSLLCFCIYVRLVGGENGGMKLIYLSTFLSHDAESVLKLFY